MGVPNFFLPRAMMRKIFARVGLPDVNDQEFKITLPIFVRKLG